jgi:hypothetical protein
MPRVDAFSIAGMDLWFWSHDHEPPHFHASRVDQWEIVVRFMLCTDDLLDFEVKWGSKPSGKDRKALLREVLAHRAQLLEEWETKVG